MTELQTLTQARRRMKVETSESYVYDPERVQALYDQLKPDPELFGDEPAYALFAYLYGSPLHGDVFEAWGDYGMWPIEDEEYDPDE